MRKEARRVLILLLAALVGAWAVPNRCGAYP